MKASPYAIYFAGVGTVITALAVGFAGAMFLTSTSVVKETPAMSAARLERVRSMKPEEVVKVGQAESAKPVEQSPSLMTTSTQIPVDVKAPAASASAPAQQVAAVQGQAAFEGPGNAVNVTLGDKPIAEPRKERRSRSSQQRKTREIIAEPGTRADEGREQVIRTYRTVRELPRDQSNVEYSRDRDSGQEIRTVTRTYTTRSSGFGGLLSDSDED